MATAAAAAPVASPAADVGADAVIALVDAAMPQYHLKAAIARVVIDSQELVTIARGETMNGVPATPEMHFHNGAIAISYMSTALQVLVEQGVVGLDDVLANLLSDLPDADTTTLRMLANTTAGYPDYVNTDQFSAAAYANPFRRWTPEDLIAISLTQRRAFAPGCVTCRALTSEISYGLGIWLVRDWLLQNPSFSGYGAFMAYLPAQNRPRGLSDGQRSRVRRQRQLPDLERLPADRQRDRQPLCAGIADRRLATADHRITQIAARLPHRPWPGSRRGTRRRSHLRQSER
jgi:hypothetical protein